MPKFLLLFSILLLTCFSHSQDFGPLKEIEDGSVSYGTVIPMDFDNDNDIDVVFTAHYPRKLAWCENLGSSKFDYHVLAYLYGSEHVAMSIGDVEGDGDNDILVSNIPEARGNEWKGYSLFENSGNGKFVTHITAYEERQFEARLGDLDSDGLMDLILESSKGEYKVNWRRNDGAFVFGQDQTIFKSEISRGKFLKLEDLDEDGDLDVLCTSIVVRVHKDDGRVRDPMTPMAPPSDQTKYVGYMNDGKANFSEVDRTSITSMHDLVNPVFLDNDADGKMDYYLQDVGKPGIYSMSWISTGKQDKSKESIPVYEVKGKYAWETWSHRDFDDDGDEDLLFAGGVIGMYWVENDGKGKFDFEKKHEVLSAPVIYTDLADMDGDTDLDLVGIGTNLLKVYKNNGDGDFDLNFTLTIGTLQNDKLLSLALEDLDQDGDVDVIVNHESEKGTIEWLRNDGTGVLELVPDPIIRHWWNGPYGDRGLFTTDMNGDGLPDVIAGAENVILWASNQGGGQFNPQSDLYFGEITLFRTADLNADGEVDILICQNDRLYWLRNKGEMSFEEPIEICEDVKRCKSMELADLNGDGSLDLVASYFYENAPGEYAVFWKKNNGYGSFGPEIILPGDCLPGVLKAEDLDKDGDIDLVVNPDNFWGRKMYWFNNRGSLGFDLHTIPYQANSERLFFKIADVDSDGAPDIVRSGPLSLVRNNLRKGCMDAKACNYKSYYSEPGNDCCYGKCGCTDTAANNYNPSVECDDGTCKYVINGFVFYDENENGIWDENEKPVQNNEVTMSQGDLIQRTKEDGSFQCSVVQGLVMLDWIPNEEFPYITTDFPIFRDVQPGFRNEKILIGITK